MKRKVWLTAALAAWAAIVLLIGAQLMVAHAVALPPPRDEARLAAALADVEPGAARRLVHVIPARCSCTRRLLGHLARRGVRRGWRETIMVAGAGVEAAAAARAAGFDVIAVPAGWPAETLGIDAAPVMIALVGDRVAWSGGYFNAPAALDALDAWVVTALEAGARPSALPVFGCPVAPRLARRLDPAGLLGWR